MATNSTPSTSASTMRLTALTPAPPTPTTRMIGWPTGAATPKPVGSDRAYTSSRGAVGAGRSMTFSGISEENAWRRRSWGDGIWGSSAAGCWSDGWGTPVSRGCGGGVYSRGSSGLPASSCSPSSVLRNSAASGPSLMLARLLGPAMGENLLREIAIGLGGDAVRVVLENGHALHGRLRKPDGLADARGEDPVAEVLLENLDRLLGVDGPRVDQRGQDALDVDVGIEVLADHLKRVLELDQPSHREILALHGDDHLVCRRQGVDRQQPEARRRVDADEVVVLLDRRERLLQRPLAADHGAQRHLRAGQVDRGAGKVDLALADHLADRELMHEHVVHRLLDRVGIDALRHREVALRVEVRAEHAMTLLGQGYSKVERGRRLRDAALLVRKCDDLGLVLHGRLSFLVGETRTCALFARALWIPP